MMPNSTTANGGVLLTVPAGKNWIGHVSLAATLVCGIGGGATTQYPSVTVSGAGGNLTDGDTVAMLALAVPAVSVTALTGLSTASSICTAQFNVQARTGPVQLLLNYGAGVTASACACGEM